MKVDFNDNIPIFIQIISAIKEDIISGSIKSGEKLPSVRELSKSLEVNPNTVQRAYMELEREGVINTHRGLGAFITEDINKISNLKQEVARNTVHTFITSMEKLGYKTTEAVQILKKFIMEEEK